MKDQEFVFQYLEIQTSIVVVETDSQSKIIWQVSLHSKLLSLLKLLLVFNILLVLVINLDRKISKEPYINTAASNHDENIDEVL